MSIYSEKRISELKSKLTQLKTEVSLETELDKLASKLSELIDIAKEVTSPVFEKYRLLFEEVGDDEESVKRDFSLNNLNSTVKIYPFSGYIVVSWKDSNIVNKVTLVKGNTLQVLSDNVPVAGESLNAISLKALDIATNFLHLLKSHNPRKHNSQGKVVADSFRPILASLEKYSAFPPISRRLRNQFLVRDFADTQLYLFKVAEVLLADLKRTRGKIVNKKVSDILSLTREKALELSGGLLISPKKLLLNEERVLEVFSEQTGENIKSFKDLESNFSCARLQQIDFKASQIEGLALEMLVKYLEERR